MYFNLLDEFDICNKFIKIYNKLQMKILIIFIGRALKKLFIHETLLISLQNP